MDSLPSMPDVPEVPQEVSRESSIGKYHQRISQDREGAIYGYKSIDRGGGKTEKIWYDKYGKTTKIGDSVIERDPVTKQPVRLRNESTGEVREIKDYGGVKYIGNEAMEGDTSWLK